MHRKRISISKFRDDATARFTVPVRFTIYGETFRFSPAPERRSSDQSTNYRSIFIANDSSRRGYFICVERKEGEGEGRKGVRNEARKEGKIDRESWRRLARCDVRKKKHCDENVTTSPVVDDRLSGARERGGTFRATSCLFGDIRHGP